MPSGNYGGNQLNDQQYANAVTIANTGYSLGASPRDVQIALAAAMTESSLINLHSGDRDSQGLFQQRPSQGWGTVQQVTDPVYAATQFYKHLLALPNRNALSPQAAAQAVQRSAFSDGSNYARFGSLGQALQKAIGGGGQPGAPPPAPGPQPPPGPGGIGGVIGDIGGAVGGAAGGVGNFIQGLWDGRSILDPLKIVDPLEALGAMGGALESIASTAGLFAKLVVWLSLPNHWVRIFAGAAGSAFLFFGLSMLGREVRTA